MKKEFALTHKSFFSSLLICLIVLILPLVLCGFTAFADAYECGIYFEIDKNPIESVEIVSDSGSELTRGERVGLSAAVYPLNARETVISTEYRIVDGSRYAAVDGRFLTVSDSAPIGARIEVIAEVDGTVSGNSLVFTVSSTPVTRVEILNSEERLAVGGAIKLESAVYPADATEKRVNYSIVSSTPYMTVSYSGVLGFVGGSVPDGELSVTVRAESAADPSVYAEKTFYIYRPAVTVTDSHNSLSEVHQQEGYSFDTKLPYLAEIFGTRAVRYSLNVDQSVAVIDINGLLYVSPTAPIGTVITVGIRSVDGEISYERTVTVAPVYATEFTPAVLTPPSVTFPEGGFYYPGSVIRFDVIAYAPANVTEANKVFTLSVSDESLAYVDGSTVVIRPLSEITVRDPKLTVTVCSEPNGLSEEFEIEIFIPVTSVTATAKPVRITEGGSYAVTELLGWYTDPVNGSIRSLTYGAEGLDPAIAVFKDGILTVDGELPEGEIVIRLFVEVDGIRSELIEYSVYKPAHSVDSEAAVNGEEISEGNLPASGTGFADTVTVTVRVDERASVNSSELVITRGAEYIEGEPRFLGLNGKREAVFELTLKRGLAYSEITPVIGLYAAQDGVISEELVFAVYIPNEDIHLEDMTVSRGEMLSVRPVSAPAVTSKRWEIRLGEDAEKYGIYAVNEGLIHVSKSIPGGKSFTVYYRAVEDSARWQSEEWKSVTYTVEYAYGGSNIFAGTYKDGFNVVYSALEGWSHISTSSPQIMAGKSLTIDIAYGDMGESITAYGMHIVEPADGIIFSCSDFTVYYVDGDTVRLTVSPNASGRLGFAAGVTVLDGTRYHEINLGSFSVFSPLGGELKLDTMTVNGQSVASLFNRTISSFNFNATELGNLKFRFLESCISVDASGCIRISSLDVSVTQTVEYSCDEYYNGVLYNEFSGRTTLKLKSVTVNKNGGSGGYDKIVAVSGLVGVSGSRFAPTREGHSFSGFGDYIDSSLKVKKDYSALTALNAKWSVNYYKITISESNTNVTVMRTDTNQEVASGSTVPYGTPLNITVSANSGYQNASCSPSGEMTMPAYDLTVTSSASPVPTDDGGGGCVATGTLVTLADGTQKPVEELDGTEMLLVWDFVNGRFDAAPVLFTVSHGDAVYTVTHLYFEDGTTVDMIGRHGFWDATLNRFVFITDEDAWDYIGHRFTFVRTEADGGNYHADVKLVGAVNEEMYTGSYSPLTYGDIVCYVNGLLSISNETQGLTNYFEVDAETMTYDAEAMQRDIETYGLADYEDFAELVSREIFDALNGQYISISMAKGLITREEIVLLIELYGEYLDLMEEAAEND